LKVDVGCEYWLYTKLVSLEKEASTKKISRPTEEGRVGGLLISFLPLSLLEASERLPLGLGARGAVGGPEKKGRSRRRSKGSRERRDDEQEQDGQLKPLSSLPVGAPPTPRRVNEQRVDTHSSAACRRIAWNGRQRGSLHFALQQLKTNTEKETNPRKTTFSSNLLSFLF